MTSGSLEHRRVSNSSVPVPRVNTWRGTSRPRRLAYAGICAGAVTALVVGPAVAALANAANPTQAAATVWKCGDKGAPTTNCSTGNAIVEVDGQWSWGELANQKSSPQQDCAGRYGVGWSVDWWGMSASQSAAAISGLQGTTINPASKSSGPSPSWGSLAPDGAWQVQGSKLYFHTSALYNGFVADLCKNAQPSGTGPEGNFSAVAVYPNRDAVPPQLCVNFYDPHGKEGQWSTSDSDNYASKDGDNSIKTNDFDPSTVSGNCLVPQDAKPAQSPSSPPVVNPPAPAPKPAALDLAILKTASASAVKTNDTLTYTLQVTNVSGAPTTGAVTVTDTVPDGLTIVGTPSGSGWTCGAVGAAVTCTLDKTPLAAGQAAAPITLTTTVLSSAVSTLVNTGMVSTPGDVNPANDQSTVRTPVTQPAQVLGTKIVKAPASPAKPAATRLTRAPSSLPFTGWNTSTAITIALALLVAGLRLINLAARRKRA